MRTSTSSDIPEPRTLVCPVAPGGVVTVHGLPYRPLGGRAVADALDRAGRAFVIVDPRDYAVALVRDPRDGALLRARCLRPDTARDLTLLAYVGWPTGADIRGDDVAALADAAGEGARP